MNFLAPEQQYEITRAADASALVAAVKESTGADLPVHNLFERFEEMCRRQGQAVDADLRPAVVKLLAAELWVNHRALGGPAKKLIPVSLYHGAVGPDLVNEFPRFCDTPGVFMTAAVSHPSDPRAFLRTVGKTIDAIAQEPEFERFRDTPGVFTRAAVDYPSDPRTFLRTVGKTIDAIAQEPEFERFRKTPSLFTRAAVHSTSDPRAFLRDVGRDIDALAQEPEFERFRDTPGIFTTAAVYHRSDPRAFLRKEETKVGHWKAVIDKRQETNAIQEGRA